MYEYEYEGPDAQKKKRMSKDEMLGYMSKKNNIEKREKYGPAASLFSHCSRVLFSLERRI